MSLQQDLTCPQVRKANVLVKSVFPAGVKMQNFPSEARGQPMPCGVSKEVVEVLIKQLLLLRNQLPN